MYSIFDLIFKAILFKNAKHLKNSSRYNYLKKNELANLRHKANILNIDTLVNNSVLIETQKNTKKTDKPNVDFYHYFLRPSDLAIKYIPLNLLGSNIKARQG